MVQTVALVEDQVIVEVPPAVTLVGFADIVTVGIAGACVTVITAEAIAGAVPLAPEQEIL
jgi:hypothetical protein